MNSKSLSRFSGVLSLVFSCVVILAGCGSTYTHVVSIAVTPASPSIAVGKTQQFTATATNSKGPTSDVTNQVTWASDTTSVATISGGGLATGVSTGSAKITATLGNIVSPPDVLTVTAAPTLVSIAITPNPPPASVSIGGNVQLTATGTYSDNSTKDLSTQVTWKSATVSIATVNAAGLVAGVAAGTSNITATLGAVMSPPDLITVASSATLVSIAVTPNPPANVPVGSNVQLTATGTYSDSTTKDLTSQVTWNSVTTSVATISTTGLVTGVTPGTSNVTATLGPVVSPVDVVTVVAALTSITLNPASATIPVGGTADFTATGHYSDGSSQILASATWSSGTPATASITGTSFTNTAVPPVTTSVGAAVGLAASATAVTIKATSGAIFGTATLTVSAAVARNAYVAGVSDGNAATYALQPASAALLPIALLLVNGSPTQIIPEPSGRFAYLLRSGTIATASIDAAGRLSGIPSVLNTTVNSNFGVVDPTGQYLYVASSGAATSTLNSYLINLVDGSLATIGSPIPVGTTANSLTSVITDRAGKYVYAIDNAGGNVYGFSIGAGGALTALATPSYPTGNSPQYPAIDPSNTHLYIPNQNDGSITAYTIKADGSLTTVAGSPFTTGIGLGPTFATFDTSATPHFFVTNAGDNTVSALNIGAGGALTTAVTGSPFGAGSAPVGIAVDPGNQSVAVVNEFGNTVNTYTLTTATGFLTPATPLPLVESPGGPIYINWGIGTSTISISPGAVFAANSVSGDISAFTSTSSTGVLSGAASSPIPGLAGNSFAAADLEGSLLFNGSLTGIQVAGASITQATAALTGLSGSPLTVTGTDKASALYIAPTDAFAYALDATAGSLVPYAITSSSSTVAGPGTSVSAFTGASNIAADPQGDFIFALGLNATNAIQPFTTYVPAGGAVAAVTQTPSLPGNWTSGAVDGSDQYLVAVDSTSKSLQSFSIGAVNSGSDGVLTAVAAGGSQPVSGTGPFVVAFDPLDRVVFVGDQAAGTVTVYPFSVSTGAISAAGAVTNVSLATGLTQISTDITGTYLYAGVKAAAAPGSKGAVAVYKIGAGGSLTAVALSPFTTGTGNPGIAVTNVVQ